MEILKKNFSIIIITLLSLGVIFYLRRQISNLIKENLELKSDNLKLKEISSKAYSEIELIKKNILNLPGEPEKIIEEPSTLDNNDEIKDRDIVIQQPIILEGDKPPIEFINVPEPIISQQSEFIIMSETIPDVESNLINNLIDNNLVHLPFKHQNSDNIQEIDDDDDEPLGDDVEEIIVELPPEHKVKESEVVVEIPEVKPEVIEEVVQEEKIEVEEVIQIEQYAPENVKVLKFNNIEKPKEEPKLNIKFQPKNPVVNDSESEKSLDYTNNDYLEINNNIPVNVETPVEEKVEINNIDYISNNYNINHVNLSSLEKLNIRDIQNISKRYKIDTKKLNSKGDKKINKTKKELCTEIISYLNI